MIAKQDILDRAGEWGLRPDIVEKDYVLGWLLSAFASHSVTSRLWVFKGGTCLKKCYFETYRFSEDLDFTLLPEAPYTEAELRETLRQVGEVAAERSGLDFPVDLVEVRPRKDRRGWLTFGAKMGYRGPLQVPTSPRVQIDITRHEVVVDRPRMGSVHHPYPDELPGEEGVLVYSLGELFGEKLRALCERTRPRDLYDVGHVLSNAREILDLDLVRRIYGEKCRFKGFEPLSASSIVALVRGSQELSTEWSNMLAHQLPELPPIESFIERLPDLLDWMEPLAPAATVLLPAVRSGLGETVLAPRGVVYWNAGPPLELVRFAGANRLLIQFDDHGKRRLAEPYSLRRPSTGNLLLYAWERGAPTIKAFKVSEIRNLQVTRIPFTPRYRIEFTSPHSMRTRG